MCKRFYSRLNIEAITDAKRVCKGFKSKKFYHDLFFQSDTLLLADIFDNFTNMCLQIYEIHSENFFQLQH